MILFYPINERKTVNETIKSLSFLIMRKTKVSLVLLFFSLTAVSQQWEWARDISIEQWDYGKLIETTNNSILVAGETGGNSIHSDVFIKKYDLNGNIQLTIIDTCSNLYGLAVDSSENVYVTVRSNVNNNYYIKKYNYLGNFLWSIPRKVFSITTYNNYLYASASLDTVFKY